MATSTIISTGSKKMDAEFPHRRVVELFGLPGAGKTFLAEKLARERALPIIVIKNKIVRWLLVFTYACRQPFNFCYFLRLIHRESIGNKRLLFHKWRLFSFAVAKEVKVGWQKAEGVIDDGLFQFALSIYEKKITETEAKLILSRLDSNRMIVIVEAENEERMIRMKNRGRVPRFFLGENYLKDWQSTLTSNYEQFKSVLVGQFESRLINN